MREKFIERNFKPQSLALIDAANEIITEYIDAGFLLTLRQLYYQFVARGLIENTQQSYKRLGSIINDARLAGLIDWSVIEDRTRNLEKNAHFDGPRDAVEAVRDQYRIDMWANQPQRLEVWIEKEALVGVIADVCDDSEVPYFACRGYVSQSESWGAYRRARTAYCEDQNTVILHLGDHDPSGIDMTRDNQDRLDIFLGEGIAEVKRLALNMDQIEELGPPPNPAKMTDSRIHGYAAKYGYDSWELDALDPSYISRLIADHIDAHKDPELWDIKSQQLAAEIDALDEIIERLE